MRKNKDGIKEGIKEAAKNNINFKLINPHKNIRSHFVFAQDSHQRCSSLTARSNKSNV